MTRRGRLPAEQRAAREHAILDAAVDELVAVGVEHLTMQAVAVRARASKETLYRWFADRDGLLRAVIERAADQSATRVMTAFEEPLPEGPEAARRAAQEVLTEYGTALLRLLTGEPSLALNRAAMATPALRAVLLESGRRRIGPVVESALTRLDSAGLLDLTRLGGPARAFEILYGLIVRDIQIRVLLGDVPPAEPECVDRARTAVGLFWQLAECPQPGAGEGGMSEGWR
ncbi:TetR/AcrR family transcriptional regulator [Ruania rhizosphaerae]|uniref:TetR/AcrR family transcriptional regulator n=1 Tax=Ruania rhizosphaerae TaxID=1840413 RepID=UPI0013570997|nr:TetR/AcrR family transcriptional regulator [Ruania rhizosphaerae]